VLTRKGKHKEKHFETQHRSITFSFVRYVRFLLNAHAGNFRHHQVTHRGPCKKQGPSATPHYSWPYLILFKMPLPSGPSGTATYFPDILELMQEAAAIACVDMTSGEAARSAKRSLDLLSMDFSNEGLNLFTTDFQVLPLVAGQVEYTLPPDTSDILMASIRVPKAGGGFIDTPMNPMDFASYSYISDKSNEGRPSQYFVHRRANPTVRVWLVPDSVQTYSLAYWRMRRVDDTGAYTNSCDVPYRFIPAMVAGLALKLAMKSRDQLVMSRIPLLQANFNDTLKKAKREDRTRASIFLAPLLEY
jgi:hypothetical protein